MPKVTPTKIATPRRRPHLLALEPRMMFDAAAAVAAQDAIADAGAGDSGHGPFADRMIDLRPADVQRPAVENRTEVARTVPVEHRAPVATESDLRDTSAPAGAPRDIIFIDTAVADYRQLAAEWAARGEVVLIDGTGDGIAQMRSALAGQSDIAAIHIVSHGSEGLFWIGTSRVDTETIQGGLAGALGEIGARLRPGGDILLYGCDFAKGAAGARALAAFAEATHADVAASTDITGAAARGGDWTLEAHRGSIEARELDSADWAHTLDPNTPVPIAVTADSLTVTNGAGTVVTTGTTGYGTDARSPDVGLGAVAVWRGAATYNGQSVDLRATVVAISAGDTVRFNRPTGTGVNGDDPTFLLRDQSAANDATVQIRWELVLTGTNTPLPADVRFTIADIDGIGGNPNTRESVTASTTNLAYFTRERTSDINFTASLSAITASGTQDENTDTSLPVSARSAATFDWSDVSAFTLSYRLTTNTVTSSAQFYHDGDADFIYTDPVYVSVPRLDLDGNDSSATGNDARVTFTENGPGVAIVDADIVVSNPMDINSITGGTVRLTNWQTGDTFTIGTLPSNITATVGAVSGGAQTITLSGLGSERDYAAAFRAITFSNTSDTPATVQRVIDISFSNNTLTSAVATSRIDVVPTNDAPTARPDTVTTAEDTTVTFAVLGNDTDPEGDTLTVTAASALHGAVMRNADGTLTYMPSPDYNGADTITYTISDGHGGGSTATVAVTVTPVNDAPDAVATLPSRSTTDAATVSYAIAAAFGDRDGDTLAYSATGLPAGLTINAATGVISGTLNRSASQVNGGNYTVTVTARDPSNLSATRSFTIAVANPGPSAVDDSASTTEDTPVTIAVLPNDSDPDGDPLTVTTASALHGTVAINANGTLRYTPDLNYNGSDTITYAISDGQGGTATARVAVTIAPANDAPTPIGTLPARSTSDAAMVSYATAGAFADLDGDTLTYSATGLPAGLTIDAATGVISGTVDRSASQSNGGNYTIVVTARDPAGASATQGFTLSVANPAPIARDDSVSMNEDTSVTIAVLGNDSDPDGDPLTVTGASALHGTVAINPDGTLKYTPNADYNGSDTITYAISDKQGGSATAAVAVTVVPVDDAPVAVGTLPMRAGSDGESVSIPTAAGFADVDGDALTYTATGLPAGLSIDPLTGVISGVIDRSASAANGGGYIVTVTATDPSGAFVRQNFPLQVTNPAPVARDDAVRTHVDTPVTVAVLANDSDPDGDPLTVTAATASSGSVTIGPDGALRYVPDAGFSGRVTVTYTISDGQGGTGSATLTIDVANAAPTVGPIAPVAATDGEAVDLPLGPRFGDTDGDALTFAATGLPAGLSIDPATGRITGTIDRAASQPNGGVYDATITASDGHGGSVSTAVRFTVANPAPVARDDAATTPEDTAVIIAVLGNDADPDGDPLTVVFATAANGTVTTNADGTMTYRPNANFTGVDQIRYTIDDGNGGRSSAFVSVTVTPVNDAPTTIGLPGRTTADGVSVSVSVAPAFVDRDGDTLTYSVTGLPPGLTIDPVTGIISGTILPGSAYGGPNGDGTYHAVVTATDPSGATVTAPFDWRVSQTAPTAADDSATTLEDTAVTIPVLANDGDADGDRLTIVDAVATNGIARIVGTDIVFTPAADFTGIATITYTVGDPAGNRATATVTVTVTPVDDAPVATPLPAARSSDGQPVVLDVGGFFRDPDGDALTYAASGLPAGLSIDPATGRITGTIDRSASQPNGGVYRVTVTATDPSGARSSSSFDWTLVNPAPVARDDTAITPEDTAVAMIVLGNDGDPDGDPLTVYGATAQHGMVTINPNGSLVYTPDRDFAGTDVIVYAIDDGDGGRATASVLVTVTPVDDAPVVLQPAPAPGLTQDGATVMLPAGGWFRDPDGDALVFTATGLPAGLSIDPVTGVIGGIVDRSASQIGGGIYPVTVTARDLSGASAATTVEIRVANPAPVATDDVGRTIQDGAGIVIPVLANERDPDGDPLTVLTANAINGTTAINPDGSVRYVPGPGFSGTDFIRYTISDGQGGTAVAFVTITVDPLNRPPVVAGVDPVSVSGGQPVRIDVLTGSRDPDGDPVGVTGASVATGTVTVNPDGTLTYVPPLGFVGTTTIGYTISDGRGGTATGTIVVRVTPGAAADVEQLLRIGRLTFQDPSPAFATIVTRDGVIRNPLSLIETVNDVRSLRGTSIGGQPVGDAVEAIRTLRGTGIDPDAPIAGEVARLDRLRDQRDAGDRLFDQRWSDFRVEGLSGFSAAADRNAGIMVESVVRGGAIYLEVRDTAEEGARAPVRSIDVRLANGTRAAWIKVDPRGLAIIERAADMDELHLIVRVTRTDGSTSATPILVQGQTGEVELDRKLTTRGHAAPLDMTLQTPNAAIQAEALRLAGLFQ